MLTRSISSILLVLASSSCGGAGTAPHDMSVAQHDRSAESDERAAALHARDYQPSASQTVPQCQRGGASVPSRLGTVCWSRMANPTEQHRREAREYRERAAQHRAASQALRDAEARACNGIAPDDRDMSPFMHVEDITSVGPLVEKSAAGRAIIERTVGARIVFRAVPGLTAEWLQRVVTCHIARSAALGHVAPSMPDCPLVPKGVQARVVSTGAGFAVEIRSNDEKVAAEILARARRLPSRAAAR